MTFLTPKEIQYLQKKHKKGEYRRRIAAKWMKLCSSKNAFLDFSWFLSSYSVLKIGEKLKVRKMVYDLFHEPYFYSQLWNDMPLNDKSHITKMMYWSCNEGCRKSIMESLQSSTSKPEISKGDLKKRNIYLKNVDKITDYLIDNRIDEYVIADNILEEMVNNLCKNNYKFIKICDIRNEFLKIKQKCVAKGKFKKNIGRPAKK